MPWSSLVALCLLVPFSLAHADHPTTQQLFGSWSGYDKSSIPDVLYRVEFTLREADADEARRPQHTGSGPNCVPMLEHARESGERLAEAGRRAPGQNLQRARELCDALRKEYAKTATSAYSWTEGIPVVGTWRATKHDSAAGTTPAVLDEPLFGEYYEAIGILRLERDTDYRYRSKRLLLVADDDGRSLAVVQTDGARNQPPFGLFRGSQVPVAVQGLIDRETDPSAAPAATRTRNATTTSTAGQANSGSTPPNTARAEYQATVKALQKQIQEAIRARDNAHVAELRQELKRVKQEYRAGVGIRQASGPTQQPDSTTPGGCPAAIDAWAENLARAGVPLDRHSPLNEISNLFRPSVFSPAHGREFVALSAGDTLQLHDNLQQQCARSGVLAGSMVKSSVLMVLSNRRGSGRVEAGLAGIAQDIVGNWHQRALSSLDKGLDLQSVGDLRYYGPQFGWVLWPAERSELASRTESAFEDRAKGAVFAALEALDARIANGEAEAWTDLHELGQGVLVTQVDPEDRPEMEARFWETVDSGMTSYRVAAEKNLARVKPGKQRLEATAQWFFDSTSMRLHFSERPGYQALEDWLYADRERSYVAAESQLRAELTTVEQRGIIISWGMFGNAPFRLPGDLEHTETGMEIERLRSARQQEIEHAIHAARVGEGPFEPEHPGAIYLNAIWRLDREQIKEEDRNIARAYMAQFSPRSNNDTLLGMASLLAGGSGRASEGEHYIAQQAYKMTLVSPLLGFFAIAYQHLYPGCMAENAVRFKKTIEWEQVTRNGWGIETGRTSFSETKDYRINPRHVPVFEARGGSDAGPGTMDTLLKIWGGPPELRDASAFIEDTFTGLKTAMRENPCDSELMQRLDANMLTLWQEKQNR